MCAWVCACILEQNSEAFPSNDFSNVAQTPSVHSNLVDGLLWQKPFAPMNPQINSQSSGLFYDNRKASGRMASGSEG